MPRVFIEEQFPVAEVGIESVRERAAASALPPVYFLHVWWARRPLVASAAAVLGSLMPTWTSEMAERFPEHPELATADAYRQWFLHLCGILGDPVAGRRAIDEANAQGKRLKGNGYGYKQAFRNSPPIDDVLLLHGVLTWAWGYLPTVLDPTAGGGSIPFESVRYGLPTHANDLNSVAAGVLRAGIEVSASYGLSLVDDVNNWGGVLIERLKERLADSFAIDRSSERVVAYIFARTVACPRTGKPVPLVGDWALRRGRKPVAVRVVTQRGGVVLDEPEFELAEGAEIDFDPKRAATWSRGKGVSPWDHLTIDSAYIKEEAQAGRMGEILYAVAVRTSEGRGFRVPTSVDLEALAAAEAELERLLPQWERDDVLPTESFPAGNDNRPLNYGMPRWRDMFTSRQLLVHGCFVEEYRKLIGEVRSAFGGDRGRADAVLALLAFIQAKAVNYNALLGSWNVGGQGIRSVFDRHDFAFKNTFAEFEGGTELYSWCLRQIVSAYKGIAGLLDWDADNAGRLGLHGGVDSGEADDAAADVGASDSGAAGGGGVRVEVTQGNAGSLGHLADGSQTLVCMDPPYYDNVMYAELADFFYVWEKRTLGVLWPEWFRDDLTDKAQEAVTNRARFASVGRRAQKLADNDYTAKMAAIFRECHRVLADEGVLTVMFTHKRADAWDRLGTALLRAGFTIEASWPVRTERTQSLHQARKNSVASTIFLVCRKRSEPAGGSGDAYFDDIADDIRSAARDALRRSAVQGLSGVDLMLSTYGPALSVLSRRWPVYSETVDPDTGRSRLLAPEDALDVARAEVTRLIKARLIPGRATGFDAVTDFVVLAWEMFKAREAPFDEARRLALAVGGLEVDDLRRAKIVTARQGTVSICEPRARLHRQHRQGDGTAEPAPPTLDGLADTDTGSSALGPPSPDGDAARDPVDGSSCGVARDRRRFAVVIDAVHTALYIVEQDGPAAAKRWLDERGLTDTPRFIDCLQALGRAVPRSKSGGEWNVGEARWIDLLVSAYFPDIELPPGQYEMVQSSLFGRSV